MDGRDRVAVDSSIEQMILQKVQLGIAQHVAPEIISSLKIDSHCDAVSRRMVYCLQMSLWGDEEKGFDVSYPADWVQAFKQRWFPLWLKRRFPVRMHTERIGARVVYPKLNISLPDERHTLVMRKLQSFSWKDWGESNERIC